MHGPQTHQGTKINTPPELMNVVDNLMSWVKYSYPKLSMPTIKFTGCHQLSMTVTMEWHLALAIEMRWDSSLGLPLFRWHTRPGAQKSSSMFRTAMWSSQWSFTECDADPALANALSTLLAPSTQAA
jgi:hypothetical protein